MLPSLKRADSSLKCNSYHGFDDASPAEPLEYDGYRIQYNSNAAEKPIEETSGFLSKYPD
jgi:hypothetical protein